MNKYIEEKLNWLKKGDKIVLSDLD